MKIKQHTKYKILKEFISQTHQKATKQSQNNTKIQNIDSSLKLSTHIYILILVSLEQNVTLKGGCVQKKKKKHFKKPMFYGTI